MFKYQTEMDAVESCPPVNLVSESRPAYRFVHSNSNQNSFLPAAKITPSRNFSGDEKCLAYGLSVYDSYENAERKLQKLKRRFRNIEKKIGDQIACGVVNPCDGKCTLTNREGHYTIFEYDGATLSSAFSVSAEEAENA